MTAILKPFQVEGALFLAQRSRALLADEPGVGKSGQLIAAANFANVDRLGIVAPSIGLAHWKRELDKWNYQGNRAQILSWDEAHEMRDELANAGGPNLQRPMWDALVLDEAHFGKNPQARRTKAAFGNGGPNNLAPGLAYYARRLWAASGTPAPNNASELWPILRAYGYTKMDLEQFTGYFCELDQWGRIVRNRADHIDELRAILKQFSLRRLKKDVLPELGPLVAEQWYVEPDTRFTDPRLAWDAMNHDVDVRMRLDAIKDDDEAVMAFLADPAEDFSLLRRFNALLKAPAVFDTVKFELENGLLDKVVIYGHHVEAMHKLHDAFLGANINSFCITGQEPEALRRQRDARIEHWRTHRDTPVLIASISIAGTVLDFTAAHQGIMLELSWVPGDNSQAMQRMHRHGQDKTVTVRVATGTPVDEIYTRVLLRKTKMTDEIWAT